MRRIVVALVMLLSGFLLALTGCLPADSPRAEFTANPTNGYPPLDVRFDAEASHSPNGPVVSYEWDFDDGSTATGKTVTHTFQDKGIFNVTLTIRDNTGDTGVASKNIQALSRPPVASFYFSPDGYVTKDTEILFDASDSYDPDGQIVEYIWSFGDGTSEMGVTVYHLFPTAGIPYEVTLTVIDDDGVSHSTSRTVHIAGCGTCGG